MMVLPLHSTILRLPLFVLRRAPSLLPVRGLQSSLVRTRRSRRRFSSTIRKTTMPRTIKDPKLAKLLEHHKAGKKAGKKRGKKRAAKKRTVHKSRIVYRTKIVYRSRPAARHTHHKATKKTVKKHKGAHKAGKARVRKLRHPSLPANHPFNRPRKRAGKAG